MKKIFLLLVLITVFAACKKTVIQDHVYDNVIYDVGKTVVYDLSVMFLANGDKNMITEMLVSNYMNTTGVKLPTNTAMRADLDKFIDATFIRFYLRNPTAYEKYYLKNMIRNDANITPELVYSSFVLSVEYWFY